MLLNVNLSNENGNSGCINLHISCYEWNFLSYAERIHVYKLIVHVSCYHCYWICGGFFYFVSKRSLYIMEISLLFVMNVANIFSFSIFHLSFDFAYFYVVKFITILWRNIFNYISCTLGVYPVVRCEVWMKKIFSKWLSGYASRMYLKGLSFHQRFGMSHLSDSEFPSILWSISGTSTSVPLIYPFIYHAVLVTEALCYI